jgi:hypothetical protein
LGSWALTSVVTIAPALQGPAPSAFSACISNRQRTKGRGPPEQRVYVDDDGAGLNAVMRGQVLKFREGFAVIDDTYNSNPKALVGTLI